MTTTGIERLLQRATRPIDGASLVVFRVAFGALLFASVVRFFAYGWIRQLYLTPTYFFTYEGFEWIKPWPGVGMYLHYAVMGVAALGIMSGLAYRASLLVFFSTFTYAELIDKTNYLNHYYFVSLVIGLLFVLPKPTRDRELPAYTAWVLRAQAGCVYVFAGLAKLNSDWLFRAEPLRFWLAREGGILETPWLAYAASWAGAGFDLFVVPALMWRKTRPLAFTAVIVFHVCTGLLFNIGLFPWMMVGAASLFLDPSWPRRVFGGVPQPLLAAPRPWLPALLALFFVHFSLQVALPFRNTIDDRFAWKVMLKERSGVADFSVVERETGRRIPVSPGDELTVQQRRMMAMQPDMIAQYGRHLGELWTSRGMDVAAVHVESLAAINGHRAAPLIPADRNLYTPAARE